MILFSRFLLSYLKDLFVSIAGLLFPEEKLLFGFYSPNTSSHI
jgi:hypothetical protein